MARKDRDMPDGVGVTKAPIVDEQTKIAAMRASAPKPAPTIDVADAEEKARIAGMRGAIPQPAPTKTKDELLLSQATTLLSKLQSKLADTYVAQGLNPNGTKKTNTQILQEKQAATAAARAAEVATNPLKNKAVRPTAPAGFRYTWIGGTNTGQWQLYSYSYIHI
jgi:hypothetical protein